jgi:hypothetical protein
MMRERHQANPIHSDQENSNDHNHHADNDRA